jgi:biopolymer transport protein ExbB/TolQ
VWLLVAIPAVMAYNFFHRCLHAILERSQRLSRILLTYLHGPAAAADFPAIPLPVRQTGRLS